MTNTQKETFKKVANKKIILGVIAILIVLAVIIVSAFVPFIVDTDTIGTRKFWSDELLVIAIVIFSTIASVLIGQAGNAQNPKSELAKAKVEFKISYETRIDNVNRFHQWVKKVLQPTDVKTIKERELIKVGIDDFEVLQLSESEVTALLDTPQKYNDRYYKALTKIQVETILRIKNGTMKINLVEPTYYLSTSSNDSDKTVSEKSGAESTKKSGMVAFTIISRTTLVLITSMILALFARDIAKELDLGEAFMSFFTRLFAMVSSIFTGYLTGCKINDVDADYIQLRVLVHTQYAQDKDFKPMDQQEEAKAEFIKRVKEESVLQITTTTE